MAAAKDNSLSQAERVRGADFAQRLSIRVLARAWQMLLKAVGEVCQADRPVMAAEMALVRLAHAADLPTPDEALRMLRDGSGAVGGNGSPAPRPPSGGGATALAARPVLASANPMPAAAQPRASALPQPQSFEEVVALASRQRDITMKLALERDVRLVKFEPGRIEFALANSSNRHFATDLSKRLKDWTGQTWLVALANTEGAPTLREQAEAARDKRESDAASHPVVRAVLERFPGARIVDVRDPRAAEAEQQASATAGDEYLPEAEPLFDDSEPDFEGFEFWTDN